MKTIDLTRRLFEDAGLGPGQRVLDVGSGHGDVAALAAELVGPTGSVVGLERNAAALAYARARGLAQVEFVEADAASPPDSLGAFDAVVTRRVLMYQADPGAVVARLVERLRPGGVFVAQEHDLTLAPASAVPMPLHERLTRVVWAMVEREGADVRIGFKLPGYLRDAGLTVEHVRAEAFVTGPEGLWQRHHPLAAILRGVAARILSTGAATEAELGLDTVDARLQAELEAAGSPWIGDVAFGVWGRRPA